MGACQFSAWQLTSQLQLNNGRREGDSTWQVINAATVQAEALKEQDVAYLG